MEALCKSLPTRDTLGDWVSGMLYLTNVELPSFALKPVELATKTVNSCWKVFMLSQIDLGYSTNKDGWYFPARRTRSVS